MQICQRLKIRKEQESTAELLNMQLYRKAVFVHCAEFILCCSQNQTHSTYHMSYIFTRSFTHFANFLHLKATPRAAL